jgi:hypothetical protein
MRLLFKSTRTLVVSLMLAAFAVRALIPAGFMPAPSMPLTLEICPEGFPTQLLGHAGHHHHGGHGQSDHCSFGGTSTGPAPDQTFPETTFLSRVTEPTGAAPTLPVVRLVYLPAVRGPPPFV